MNKERTESPTPGLLRAHARVTLQLKTPLHIGSGEESDIADADIVRDANQLPAIPGSSLAGVLKSLSKQAKQNAESIFGSGGEDGHGSRLSLSWGHLHDTNNLPVDGVLDSGKLPDDKVLKNALAASLRDHVRINERGVAADGGKFDELCLPVGHRFTFSLELQSIKGQSKEAFQDEWHSVLSLFYLPGFRLGGRTRRGFGSVEVIALRQRIFDLAQTTDFEAYTTQLPVSLATKDSCLEARTQSENTSAWDAKTLRLLIKPRHYWMFGGGEGESTDMAPVRESCITWNAEAGAVMKDCILLPGSSIKGALSHRVAFHDNCLRGNFVDENRATDGSDNPSVKSLFGFIKDDVQERGKVLIDDILLKEEDATPWVLNHVKIDRFTGGAWPGALFDETVLHGAPKGGIEITLTFAEVIDDPDALQALDLALRDLATGHLALGGGTGRGHGRFELLWASIPEDLKSQFPEMSQLAASSSQEHTTTAA